jgi:hypothetical protein
VTARLAERVKQFLSNPPADEEGEPHEIALLPPTPASRIAALEQELGQPVSTEIKELLEYCGGIQGGALEGMTFMGKRARYVYPPSMKERFLELAMDGFGNFWFYWQPIASDELGPVYYYQHEGPMFFYQSASLVDFIEEWMRFMTPPYKSLIDDVHEFRIKPIKELNSDLLERSSVMSGSDEVLKEFICSLDGDVLIYDFRRAKIGDGVDLRKLDLIAVHQRYPILAVRRRGGWKLFKSIFVGRK